MLLYLCWRSGTLKEWIIWHSSCGQFTPNIWTGPFFWNIYILKFSVCKSYQFLWIILLYVLFELILALQASCSYMNFPFQFSIWFVMFNWISTYECRRACDLFLDSRDLPWIPGPIRLPASSSYDLLLRWFQMIPFSDQHTFDWNAFKSVHQS